MLNFVFGGEPTAVEHLVDVIVWPGDVAQLAGDGVQPVEDEEDMQLGAALKVLLNSILYHSSDFWGYTLATMSPYFA